MKAFPEYKDDPSWIAVAKYLFGEDDWKEKLGLNVVIDEPPAHDDDNNDDDESERSTAEANDDPLNPQTIADFMVDFPCDMEHDLGCEKLKVYAHPTSDDDSDASSDASLLGENEPEMDYSDGKFFKNETDATAEFNSWTTGAKKSALKFLKLHVHKDHVKKSCGYKDVVKWLTKPNAVRNYLFYTSKGLKALMSARKLTFASGPSSVDRMISALANLPGNEAQQSTNSANEGADASDTMSPTAAATRAILAKSFMPHQKGEKREHCSLGHRLEVPILRNFISSIQSAPEYNAIVVRGAYSAGLAAKVGKPYAKDSIDFVLAVDDLEEGSTQMWGFEAKGRVTVGTAATEEEHQYAERCSWNKHLRIDHKEVYQEICREGERWQIMQHAYVYNMNTIVYAIGDSGAELIRTLVVDFSAEIKNHFGNVLEELKKVALSWAYPEQPTNARRNRVEPLEIPDEIIEIANSIPTINGEDTLRSTANLWHTLRRMPLPLPPCKRIIPAIYAYWNSVKGGSDTTTKLMDDCLIQIPKCHMNTETVAVSRLVMLVYVLNHRLSQINSGKDNLDFYKSLFHWRQAASRRSTFHSTLLRHHKIFKQMLTDIQEAPAAPPPLTPIRQVSPSSPPRRTRSALVDGVMPQSLNLIAPRLPTQTPKRIAAIINKGNASTPIRDMVKRCTGVPMQVYPVKSNYTCAVCRRSTSWYCAGCKRWVCLNVKGMSSNSKQREIYSKKFGDDEKNFTKACFHIMHEKAWERKKGNEENI